MKEPIRIRCQVLKVIAAIGPCDSGQIHKELPDLSIAQVQKTCQRLSSEDDEIKIVATRPRPHGDGRPWNVYVVRGEAEPREKKVYEKTGRKSRDQLLQRPLHYDPSKGRVVIRYRDRKIALLQQFLPVLNGADKDLLIGIINDLKQ